MSVQSNTERASTVSSHQTASPVSKIIPFNDGDETIRVRLIQHSRNVFFAIEHDSTELFIWPMGCGDTEMSAIADLFAKLPRAASEREERDEMAARFDHAQDHRKNWVA